VRHLPDEHGKPRHDRALAWDVTSVRGTAAVSAAMWRIHIELRGAQKNCGDSKREAHDRLIGDDSLLRGSFPAQCKQPDV
jgi:hypothetical protein